MGQEISRNEFRPQDFAKFEDHLRAELKRLALWFKEGKFVHDELRSGLVDSLADLLARLLDEVCSGLLDGAITCSAGSLTNAARRRAELVELW